MTQSIFLEIATSFHLELPQARFAFSIASICYSAAFFFIGPMADRFDLPKMAVTGAVALSCTIFVGSFATRFPLFLVAMGCSGFCAALIPASMIPHMTLLAPQEKRGLYVGTVVAAGTLGIVLGRVAVGLLTAQFGWPVAFRVMAALLATLAALALAYLVDPSSRRPSSPLSVSALYLRSFQLLTRPTTVALLATGFFLFFGFLGMVTFLTYRLVAPPFLFTAGEVGWISLAGLTALVAPFAGTLSQRTGIFKISIPGLGICLGAAVIMGTAHTVPLITFGLLLLFAGAYCCQPLIFLLIGQSIPQESLGSASSLYILCCIGGGSLSSVVLGSVWTTCGWGGVTIACVASLAMAGAILGALAWRKGVTSPVPKPAA